MSDKPNQGDDSNPPKPKRDQSGYFKNWYAENGQDLQARRRKKYHSDPDAREKQLAATRDYKHRNPPEPQGSVRKIGGEKVKVHRIGTVAEVVDRSVLTLRQWEQKGWVPPASEKQGDHRVYTDHQVKLMGQLAVFLHEHRYAVRHDTQIQAQFAALVEHIKQVWQPPCSDVAVETDNHETS